LSAEIVYNVSATRNIGQGLQQFGVSSLTTSVLIVSYGTAMKTTLNAVRAAINGLEIEDVSSGLSSVLNKDRVRDAYDISPLEEQTSDLVQSIVTRIAVRDVR
jgi:Kinase binding protein CGI-121